MDSEKATDWTPDLTAQQTSLIRAVLDTSYDLERAPAREPLSGKRAITPLGSKEILRFRSIWREAPVGCIQSMNRAIAQLEDPARLSRYLEAAIDLELLMDRESQALYRGRELKGVPVYLADGYTDFGVQSDDASARRRERIVVDKEKLRLELARVKRHAVEAMSGDATRRCLASELRELATTLRQDLGFREEDSESPSDDDTVPLSRSVERQDLNCRHLSILYQLRLQEAGISSRLVKGVLRLFRFKLRHVWNVAESEGEFAIADVSFADKDGPFVLSGATLAEVYQRAAERDRIYCPIPETWHRYQVRTTRSES